MGRMMTVWWRTLLIIFQLVGRLFCIFLIFLSRLAGWLDWNCGEEIFENILEKLKRHITIINHFSSLLHPNVVTTKTITGGVNPLEFDHIFKMVCQNFTFWTIQELRLVSKKWNHMAIGFLAAKNNAIVSLPDLKFYETSTLPQDHQHGDSLTLDEGGQLQKNVLGGGGDVPEETLLMKNFRFYFVEDIKFFQNCRRTPPLLLLNPVEVRRLEFMSFYPDPNSHLNWPWEGLSKVCQLIMACPHLTVVKVPFLDFDRGSTLWRSRIENSDDDGGRDDFEKFMDKLDTLSHLFFSCSDSSNGFQHWIPVQSRLRAIKNLWLTNDISNSNRNVMDLYMEQQPKYFPWQLQSVRLMVTREFPVELVRNFFHSVAPTLEDLHLGFWWSTNLAGDYDLPTTTGGDWWWDDWYLPQSILIRLKNLSIFHMNQFHIVRGGHFPSADISPVLRTLVTSFSLRGLRSLEIFEADEENFGSVLMIKDGYYGGRGKIQNSSVHKLILANNGNGQDLWFRTQPPLLFPQLTQLSLRVCQKNVDGLHLVFATMREQLTSLRLTLVTDKRVDHIGANWWDKYLNGWNHILPPPSLSKIRKGHDRTMIQSHGSIKDLKRLKTLEIYGIQSNPGMEGWYKICHPVVVLVSDLLIYGALIHMKKLDSLIINCGKFSEGAVTDLRKALNGTQIKIATPPWKRWPKWTPHTQNVLVIGDLANRNITMTTYEPSGG